MIAARIAAFRQNLNEKATAYAAAQTDIDADGHVFKNILLIMLALAASRLVYVLLCDVPIGRERVFGTWALGVVLYCSAIISMKCKLAEATLVLRAGAILGLCAPLFSTFCDDIFYSGRTNPMIDAALARADQVLGFDWLGYARYLDRHEFLWACTKYAYLSIFLQFVLVIAVMAFSRDASRLYAYLLAQTLALSFVALVALALPAVGAYEQYDVAHAGLKHTFGISEQVKTSISWLRAGAHGVYGVEDVPLITFPSYHACCAVLFIWAMWGTRGVRWAGLILNITMLAAIPTHGCHYLVDILLGMVIAALAIVFSQTIVARCAERQSTYNLVAKLRSGAV